MCSAIRIIKTGTIFFWLVWAVVISYSDTPQTEEAIEIAVFTPTTAGNTYWPEVHDMLRSTAKALDIRVNIHEFSVLNRFLLPEMGPAILRSDPAPDAAIFCVSYGQARPLMEIAEERGIPFFLNGPLLPDELAELGFAPRQRYRFWVGYFHEDEVAKGYILGRFLIESAIASGRYAADGSIQLAAVGGDHSWHGSALREQGLRQAVSEFPEARLMQTVATYWTVEEGRNMTVRLFDRYPELAVIWAASDQLAIGVAEALENLGLIPGKDIFTGGLDYSRTGLKAVSADRLTATVGCSSIIWSCVLVFLHDYLNGYDFSKITGTTIIFPPQLADRAAVEEVLFTPRVFNEAFFRNMSLVYGTGDYQCCLFME